MLSSDRNNDIGTRLIPEGWHVASEPFWNAAHHRDIGKDRTVIQPLTEIASSKIGLGPGEFLWREGLISLPPHLSADDYRVRYFKCRNSMNDFVWWETSTMMGPGSHA